LPDAAGRNEKHLLRELLLSNSDHRLGALPDLWRLQQGVKDDAFAEESLHNHLEQHEPRYAPLLAAIRAYESFSRSIQDAFDVLPLLGLYVPAAHDTHAATLDCPIKLL
jgi:hypothetical protein